MQFFESIQKLVEADELKDKRLDEEREQKAKDHAQSIRRTLSTSLISIKKLLEEVQENERELEDDIYTNAERRAYERKIKALNDRVKDLRAYSDRTLHAHTLYCESISTEPINIIELMQKYADTYCASAKINYKELLNL